MQLVLHHTKPSCKTVIHTMNVHTCTNSTLTHLCCKTYSHLSWSNLKTLLVLMKVSIYLLSADWRQNARTLFFVTVLRTFHFPAKAVTSYCVNQGVRNGRGMLNAEIDTLYKSAGDTEATTPLVKTRRNWAYNIIIHIRNRVCKEMDSIHTYAIGQES
jgi:hypothetical protein